MKLRNIMEDHGNNENLTLINTPPAKDKYITTSQAAKILKVTASRVRQLIQSGQLQAMSPEKGRRDNLISMAAVRSLNKTLKRTPGRAPSKNLNESISKLDLILGEAEAIADCYNFLIKEQSEDYADNYAKSEILRISDILEISPDDFHKEILKFL